MTGTSDASRLWLLSIIQYAFLSFPASFSYKALIYRPHHLTYYRLIAFTSSDSLNKAKVTWKDEDQETSKAVVGGGE